MGAVAPQRVNELDRRRGDGRHMELGGLMGDKGHAGSDGMLNGDGRTGALEERKRRDGLMVDMMPGF